MALARHFLMRKQMVIASCLTIAVQPMLFRLLQNGDNLEVSSPALQPSGGKDRYCVLGSLLKCFVYEATT